MDDSREYQPLTIDDLMTGYEGDSPNEDRGINHNPNWYGDFEVSPNEPRDIEISPIEDRNFDDTPNEDQYIGEGVAYQVHNVFANIEENMDAIFKTMGGKLTVYPLNLTKNEFFHSMNRSYLECANGLDADTFKIYENKINEILEKLYRSNFIQLPNEPYDGVCENIFTWQQFVLRQPNEFRTHYIQCFIEDTYKAYDVDDVDEETGISCVKGIYERTLTSIGDACILYCTEFKKKKKRKTKKNKKNKKKAKGSTRSTSQSGGKYNSRFRNCDNPVYKKLIKLFKKEIPDINELTKEWATIFEDESSANLTPDQLKADFIKYMNRKYSLYGLNKKDIVEKRAQDLADADIFKNREFG